MHFSTCFACDTGGTPYYNAYFGASTGPIFLDDVACTSSANQLLECSSSPVLAHNCDHNADAGVGCEGRFLLCKSIKNDQHKHCRNVTALYYCCSSMQHWSSATGWR